MNDGLALADVTDEKAPKEASSLALIYRPSSRSPELADRGGGA